MPRTSFNQLLLSKKDKRPIPTFAQIFHKCIPSSVHNLPTISPELQNTVEINQQVWKPHGRTQVIENMPDAIRIPRYNRKIALPVS